MNDDYKEAASVLDEIIISNSPRDWQGPRAKQIVAAMALIQSVTHETPEYSEAIYCDHVYVLSSSSEENCVTYRPKLPDYYD